MGRDKALLTFQGKPFIKHIAETLQKVFKKVVIISDYGEAYKFLGLPIYENIFKCRGPLGGIHSALSNVKTQKAFIVSCDMPFLPSSTIRHLLENRGRGDVTLFAVNGRI